MIPLGIANNVIHKALQCRRDGIRACAHSLESMRFNVLHRQALRVLFMHFEPVRNQIEPRVWVLTALLDGVEGHIVQVPVWHQLGPGHQRIGQEVVAVFQRLVMVPEPGNDEEMFPVMETEGPLVFVAHIREREKGV